MTAVPRLSTGERRSAVIRRFGRLFARGRWAAFLLLALLLGLRALDPWWVEAPRLLMFDRYQALSPRDGSNPQVMVVDIDEASLEALGQWPWSRRLVADLVTHVMEAGAQIVGFDILFAEPDRLSPEAFSASTPNLPRDIAERLAAMPTNDSYLAEVLTDNRAVLGLTGSLEGTGASAPKPRQPAVAVRNIVSSEDDPRRYLVGFPSVVGNLPVLENAAAGRGFLSINPERDSVVRRIPAIARIEGVPNPYPTLSIEILRVLSQSSNLIIRSQPGVGIQDVVLQEAKIVIPTDTKGRLYPHFSMTPKSRYISAKDVLSGAYPKDSFVDKIVLVGASASGLRDIRSTPVEAATPGVEIHAQLLESIVADSLLTRPDWADMAELLAVLAIGLLVIAGLAFVGAKLTMALFAVVAAALFFLSWRFFSADQLLLDATFPTLTAFLLYLTLTYGAHVTEESERRRTRDLFGRYVSKAVVERVLQEPGGPSLSGEKREVSLLFSDLAGFTSLSEALPPEVVLRLLNTYFEEVCRIIIDNGGIIVDFIGDAVFALFGAPEVVPDYPARALAAATALDRFATNFAREQNALGIPLGQTRIGVHTGFATVGNVGSKDRLKYSATGDVVNTSSRLEGANKNFGTRVLASTETIRKAGGLVSRPVGDIILKGRKEALPVSEVFTGEPPEWLGRYLAAYEQLANGQPEATTAFADLARDYPKDGVVQFHHNRIQAGLISAVIELTEK